MYAAAFVEHFQRVKTALQIASVAGAWDTRVHFHGTLRRDDVAACASANHAGADRDAAVETSEARDPPDLARHFDDRTRAFFEIEAGMGGDAAHGNGKIADAFPRSLQLSAGSGRF